MPWSDAPSSTPHLSPLPRTQLACAVHRNLQAARVGKLLWPSSCPAFATTATTAAALPTLTNAHPSDSNKSAPYDGPRLTKTPSRSIAGTLVTLTAQAMLSTS
ncbi:hypothetical protein B0J13DRAFT_681367, partial [Dactylonectria estremocensis]